MEDSIELSVCGCCIDICCHGFPAAGWKMVKKSDQGRFEDLVMEQVAGLVSLNPGSGFEGQQLSCLS